MKQRGRSFTQTTRVRVLGRSRGELHNLPLYLQMNDYLFYKTAFCWKDKTESSPLLHSGWHSASVRSKDFMIHSIEAFLRAINFAAVNFALSIFKYHHILYSAVRLACVQIIPMEMVCALPFHIAYCLSQHFISIAVWMARSTHLYVLSAVRYLKFQSIVLLLKLYLENKARQMI